MIGQLQTFQGAEATVALLALSAGSWKMQESPISKVCRIGDRSFPLFIVSPVNAAYELWAFLLHTMGGLCSATCSIVVGQGVR